MYSFAGSVGTVWLVGVHRMGKFLKLEPSVIVKKKKKMWQAAEELLLKDDRHICNLLLPPKNKSCRPKTATALGTLTATSFI